MSDRSLARGAFWASAGFYGLVALEFFYMVTPFAAYAYGLYGPGLATLHGTEATSWLVGFFMPHIVRETRSLLITWHEAAGAMLLLAGLATFAVGAVQVYRSKLGRRGAVTGGLYRWIRHPQYLALMVAGLGMLLLWPRYLVVFGFVTVCFAYYLLARVEERLCERDFTGYVDYRAGTGMFLPGTAGVLGRRVPWPRNRAARLMAGVGVYAVALLFAFGWARWVHERAIASLYAHETPTAVYVSVGALEPDTIASLARLAARDPAVAGALARGVGPGARLINYVMPTDLWISEVPMHIPPGARTGHRSPRRMDQHRYKIVFTEARFGVADPPDGRRMLLRATNTTPVVEVWIDRAAGVVERVLPPPSAEPYGGMPVPVF